MSTLAAAATVPPPVPVLPVDEASFPVASHGVEDHVQTDAARAETSTSVSSTSIEDPSQASKSDVASDSSADASSNSTSPSTTLNLDLEILPPRPCDIDEPIVNTTPHNSEASDNEATSSSSSTNKPELGKLQTLVRATRSLSTSTPISPAASRPPSIYTPVSRPQSIFASLTSALKMNRLSKSSVTSTDVIDEFAGLDFAAILNSYLEIPEGANPNDPKQSADARLHDAVTTATALLDRVYSSYRSRTTNIGDTLSESDCLREELQGQKILVSNLKVQLERVVTSECEAQNHLHAQAARIRQLEEELASERREKKAMEEELWVARRNRCKRVSAGSDSGFESDVESVLSRSTSTGAVTTVGEEGEQEACEDHSDCGSTTPAAQGAETKQRTPLRESWSPTSDRTPTQTPVIVSPPQKQGVWAGLFKNKRDSSSNGDVWSENRYLRERVRELEKAVDGALDAIAGRGI
jgi:hypothetical protein